VYLTLATLALLTAMALVPLVAVLRRASPGRDRKSTALALHRAQLAELSRERDAGRIAAADYDAAVLEVQRRLLADDRLAEAPVRVGRRAPLVVACVLLPVAAGVLYSLAGRPDLPAEPLIARNDVPSDARTTEALVAALRAKLVAVDPSSETARQGWVLLGNIEDRRGNLGAAAAAWRRAVAIRFDATLAVLAAEAHSRTTGALDSDSRALFTRALAEAPPNAPWRDMAEQRLRGP